MSIAFVNKTSAVAHGNAVTVTTPGSLVVGNVLIWTVARSNGGGVTPAITAPTGWLWLVDGVKVGSPVTLDVKMFYRVVDGTEAANYTADLGVGNTLIGEIAQYSGADPVNPIYSQQCVASDFFASSTTDFLFEQVGFDENLGVEITYQIALMAQLNVLATYTAPGGYTNQYGASDNFSGIQVSLGIFDAPGYGVGLSAPVTVTSDTGSTVFEGFRIFLRPAGTTSPPTLTWTMFDPFQVPPSTNWPFMLKDSDNTALYTIYTTNPLGGTMLDKYNLVTRTLTLSTVLDAGVAPSNDNCMTQDATHLYIALQDGALRKVRKSDLVQIGISAAPFDCGAFMCPTYNGSILWSTEDCGDFLYQFDPTTLAISTFDNSASGLTILSLTSDNLGNAWALAYNPVGPLTKIIKITSGFATTVYDVSADLPISDNTEAPNDAIIGFDPTTGYLWAAFFLPEDVTIPVLSNFIVWNPATTTTVNSFVYGKDIGVAHTSIANGLGVWDSTTRSRWLPYTFLADLSDKVYGTPGFADLVRFNDQGVFQEKVPIENPPLDSPELLQELQSAMISIQASSQDVWMVLHADLPDGTCIKQIAVISEALTPLTPPTTTCFDLVTVDGEIQGTIHGANLANTTQVTISPTDDPDDPSAYQPTILTVSDTAVTVAVPDGQTGEGYWFVSTTTGEIVQVSAGNNEPCAGVPTTTCVDLGTLFQVPYGTIHGENLGGTYKVLIVPINNQYDGNAYNAPLLEVTDTSVTVFIPNSTIGEGYWFVFTDNGVIQQVSQGNNRQCEPLGLSWWKTRKVWFETLEP